MRKIIFIILFSISFDSLAYSCTGSVKGVVVSPSGQVFVEQIGSLQWVKFCSTSTELGGVKPSACRTVLATLLTAQTTGKDVRIWFQDALDCTTHPLWQQPSGWYFGPQILD